MAHFSIPAHICMGANALNESAVFFSEYGKRALIVTGPHVAKSPMVDRLIRLLSELHISYFIFDGITGEPTDVMVQAGVEAYVKGHCDFLIGIGGGSPLDAAKAIAVMAVSEGSISDYMGKEIVKKLPPIVAIPTTSGTGSEATKFTVITDSVKDIKMLLKGECLIPQLAILQEGFTMDMPKGVTASTGLDALTHAVEAYTSKKAMPLTDVYAESAIKRIMKYLPIAYRNGNDGKARDELSLAAFEAGVCINNSSVTIVHGMSRPIGALFHIPHGKSNAMLLVDCLSFALEGALERFAHLGRVVGVATEAENDETAAKAFLSELEKVVQICEIPTLREYGIDPDRFCKLIPKMASDAIASKSPDNTRKNITEEDCISIYKQVIAH